MASLSPSCNNPIVTQEEFKTFHNIDRILYTRLALNLDRDPAESMQVMALLIWLERAGHASDLVVKMLSLPDTLINSMADETVLCLTCVENDKFRFSPEHSSANNNSDIPLIQCVTKTGLSLQFFYENRFSILGAVSKIVNEVCARAFDDILRQAEKFKAGGEGKQKPSTFYHPGDGVYGGNHGHMGGYYSGFLHGFQTFYYDLSAQREILNNEIGDLLSNLQISISDDQDNGIVPADDRTIFLTFSKGYPISEVEVRDFFNRKYGGCIEAIHMQEVLGEDQPLYARLIVHSPTIIEVVLEGKSKAKFSINGKHVWARKYVRKNPRLSSLSPPRSSSPSQPTSPISLSEV